jgi:TolB-like protein/tetratricopeptide (TPR) repeat protein
VGFWWSRARALDARGVAELRRIGVLYFKDLSPDGHLTDLADGLSEALIERLRDVQTLDVVSRDGVAPYRRGDVPADSVARTLKVGTIVTGTVEQEGDAVRIAMRLRDASGADFQRVSFTVPQAALLSARDSVARVTSEMLRPVIGEEVKLREERHAAHDALAWSLVQRAERLRREQADRGAVLASGVSALSAADSLAALAETRDPAWSDPAVLRGRIALLAARQAPDGAGATRWLDAGMGAADRALAIDPRSADALEVRGALRYERYIRNLAANPAEERTLLRGAEADLLRATELNPAQANAWNVLSALDYRKPDVEMANIHARRALEADAYLAAADEVLWRLFATSYDVGHHDDAVKWCTEGHQRFPASARFVQCRLYIGVLNRDHPDVADAWRAVRELVERTPPDQRPLVERQARLLAAIALVYAGQRDSAARVVDRVLADRGADPEGALGVSEALALDRLGRRDDALRVIKSFMAAHPQHLRGMTRNTWWWKDLENDPEFKALVGGHR